MASKVVSVAFLWLTITASILFAVQQWWLRALLLLIAIGVSWHILALKTLTREMQAELDQLDTQSNNGQKSILPEA